MSEIISHGLNESDNIQQENSHSVDRINYTFQENFNLTYPFDKWQTICSLFWILIFIICAIILILLSTK